MTPRGDARGDDDYELERLRRDKFRRDVIDEVKCLIDMAMNESLEGMNDTADGIDALTDRFDDFRNEQTKVVAETKAIEDRATAKVEQLRIESAGARDLLKQRVDTLEGEVKRERDLREARDKEQRSSFISWIASFLAKKLF